MNNGSTEQTGPTSRGPKGSYSSSIAADGSYPEKKPGHLEGGVDVSTEEAPEEAIAALVEEEATHDVSSLAKHHCGIR